MSRPAIREASSATAGETTGRKGEKAKKKKEGNWKELNKQLA